jgi:hypothetical protein
MKTYIKVITIAAITLFASCVQKEHMKTVTFSVDMNGIENVTNVGIKGDFTDQAWRQTIPLSDEDGDGIYEITFNRETAAYGIEFKFVKNDNQIELEGEDNRELVFEYKPETIQYQTKFNDTQNTTIKRN